MPVPARRAATAEPRAQKTALLIARRIVSNIERSGLTVGDKLPREKEMLLEYQVSRSTLREALRFLELQGIVALKPGPGGGPVVQRPEPGNLSTLLLLQLQFSDVRFRSVYEARTYLEPIMAGLAAGRMSGRDLRGLLLAKGEYLLAWLAHNLGKLLRVCPLPAPGRG